MSWYDKYLNKIAFNDDFFYVLETGLLYKAASKATHPRGTNCIRWYEYYFDDDNDKFIRVTEKMRTGLSGKQKN